MAAAVQTHCDNAVSAWKALGTVKSLKEVIDVQTSFARTSFEHGISETGKIVSVALKVADDAVAPVKARMTLSAERLAPPIA